MTRIIIIMAAAVLVVLLITSTLLCVRSELVTQLTDSRFPDRSKSSRVLTNNKRLFKAYAGQEMVMTIQNSGVKHAILSVNGKECDISKQLNSDSRTFSVDISRLIRDGNDNTLSMQEISPAGAYLDVFVPYPALTYGRPEDVGMNPLKLSLIDNLIRGEVKNGFPGAGLIIAKNGKIVKREVYGYARKYKDGGEIMDKFEPLENHTLFDIASNTKMFATNFAVMKLFAEEKLNYLDNMTKYIPEYSGADNKGERREERLIFDFLTHTAGYEPDPLYFNPKKVSPEKYSLEKSRTAQILLKLQEFERHRGGSPVYSDVDYMLLGILVEQLSGMSLDEYVESTIYKRLGLGRTCFNPLKKGFAKNACAATEILGNTGNRTEDFPHIRTEVLQCEVHDPKAFYCMQGVSGHAGLFSDLEGMAVLSQVLLNRGGYAGTRLWDRDTQDCFTKPYDLDVTFGLGWRRQGNQDLTWHFSSYGSPQAVGHTGWTGTATVIDPKHDLVVVLLTNKKHSPIVKGSFERGTSSRPDSTAV